MLEWHAHRLHGEVVCTLRTAFTCSPIRALSERRWRDGRPGEQAAVETLVGLDDDLTLVGPRWLARSHADPIAACRLRAVQRLVGLLHDVVAVWLTEVEARDT